MKIIIGSMLRSEVFVTLEPYIKSLDSTCINFENLIAKAEDGSKKIILEKNLSRADFEAALRSLALKVQVLSAGDEYVIRCSGFKMKKNTKRIPGLLAIPINVTGVPGVIKGL